MMRAAFCILVFIVSIVAVLGQDNSRFFKPSYPVRNEYPRKLYGMVAQESQDPLAYFVQNQPSEVFNAAAKRNIHRVQARAVNTFKNCYFSPVQCVLLERRRRSVQV